MKSKSLRGSRKGQAGFTLVEIAIVLVIIGLLLGGVLKGQELIDSAKTRNAINDMNGITAAYNGYVDRFRQIPGDDGALATLQARGSVWTGTAGITAAGDADSTLDIAVTATFTPGATATSEGLAFWQHLKAAGFLAGSPSAVGTDGSAALPRNAFNGLMGVSNNNAATPETGAPAGLVVCLSQVPGKAARQLDTQLDNGDAATGSLRATEGTAGANTPPATAATAYSDEEQYTVCKSL